MRTSRPYQTKDAIVKHFSADQLERALDLHEHVEAHRLDINTMDDNRRRSVCELWVSKARHLLEKDLRQPDKHACLWVLHVLRGIARDHQIYLFGLGRNQTDNWGRRFREACARLRPTRAKQEAKAKAKATPKAKLAKAAPAVPSLPELPYLAGHTIVIVGGEEDPLVMHRYKNAPFTLDWIPANVRQVQSVATRIRLGHLGGVVFLTDLNRHASFEAVRTACRFSGTPMVLGTRGITAIGRALQGLNERLTKPAASA